MIRGVRRKLLACLCGAGLCLSVACAKSTDRTKGDPGLKGPPINEAPERRVETVHPRQLERTAMVDRQLAGRDLVDPRVLSAMKRVPRHRFVPRPIRHRAYDDTPLPIGQGQTISQPYIVGLMTELIRPHSRAKVLDIGTGSGYQAAVAAEIVDHVYGIDIVCELADDASKRLAELGYRNTTITCGDGYMGWPEHAPFDAIIVAAAPKKVPPALLAQLKPGGRLVIPIGTRHQELRLYVKGADGSVSVQHVAPVRFVPFVRNAGEREAR